MSQVMDQWAKGISRVTGLGEETIGESKIAQNYRKYIEERAGNPAAVYRAAAARHRAAAVELEARARRLYGQMGMMQKAFDISPLGSKPNTPDKIFKLSERADELMRKADRRRAKADRAEEMARNKNMMSRYSHQIRR